MSNFTPKNELVFLNERIDMFSRELTKSELDYYRLKYMLGQIYKITTLIENLTTEIALAVKTSKDISVKLVKMHHLLYRISIGQALIYRTCILDPHDCELHKWIKSVNHKYHSIEEFRVVVRIHDRYHMAVDEIIEAYHNNNWNSEKDIMILLNGISAELVQSLTEFENSNCFVISNV
jgi:hypothetical protein